MCMWPGTARIGALLVSVFIGVGLLLTACDKPEPSLATPVTADVTEASTPDSLTSTPVLVPDSTLTNPDTPTPSAVPANSPTPTSSSTRTPFPMPTSTATPVPTPVPATTPTPAPDSTPVPAAAPTSVTVPSPVPATTPTQTPVPSPVPADTPTQVPVASPVPVATPTPEPTSSPSPKSPPVFEVASRSPTEVNLAWSFGLKTPVRQALYRDDKLKATPPVGQTSFVDKGLNSNTRYKYKMAIELKDGSLETAEASTVTLAHPPMMAGPMNVEEYGFTLAIVDDLNPLETTYRITVSDGTEVVHSDWDTGKSREFSGLLTSTGYNFEVVAKNLDGIETEPVRWIYNEGPDKPEHWGTQGRMGNSDSWVIDRINDLASLYGLTERAKLWMLKDIRVRDY